MQLQILIQLLSCYFCLICFWLTFKAEAFICLFCFTNFHHLIFESFWCWFKKGLTIQFKYFFSIFNYVWFKWLKLNEAFWLLLFPFNWKWLIESEFAVLCVFIYNDDKLLIQSLWCFFLSMKRLKTQNTFPWLAD